MFAFSINYLKDRGGPRAGRALDCGFWIHGVPRVVAVCRVFGHKPVVDGTDPIGVSGAHRWVCCNRCGVRPDPQGSLNPDQWTQGDRYTGPWGRSDAPLTGPHEPGQWPTNPTGVLGGQLVIGKTYGGVGFELKVGHAGSENTLAANITCSPIGALYLHTEGFGTWLQRRLVPRGYDSRVIGIRASDGRVTWKLWAKRDGGGRGTPWWQEGSISYALRDKLLGHRRYSYTEVGEPVTATVRMPHGDDHEVTLQLKRQSYGRAKGRKKLTWSASWDCPAGIPTKQGGRGRIMGSGVPVGDDAVENGTWAAAASAAIAVKATAMRTRYGMTTV